MSDKAAHELFRLGLLKGWGMKSGIQQNSDSRWMGVALDLARTGEGRTRPNPPVGAVVVAGNRIVGKGYHHVAGRAHAEVLALKSAGRRAKGATLYVTLEPCSTHGKTGPCTDSIIRSGIVRVVVTAKDPNPKNRGKGLRLLRKAGLEVVEGVCAEEALVLIAPFAKWIRTGIPLVTLKMAMTLDGRIADIEGNSNWISSERSRRMAKVLRGRADAVLVGAETVCRDDPGLLPERRSKTGPHRIVVDSTGRIPFKAKILNDGHVSRTIIAVTKKCSAVRRRRYEALGAQVWRIPAAGGRVSLRVLLKQLGALGLHHVLCEGGAELAGSMIRCGLVDRYLFFVAPKILGGRGALPAVTGKGWRLKSCPKLRFLGSEVVGDDVVIESVSGE